MIKSLNQLVWWMALTSMLSPSCVGCSSEFRTVTTIDKIDHETTHDLDVKPLPPIPISANGVPNPQAVTKPPTG